MKISNVLLTFAIGVPVLLGLGALYIFLQVPSEETIKGCFKTNMYGVELCPGSKNYIPLSQISPLMAKTVVLTEDSLFFQHKGFDWASIEKSAKENLEKGQYVRGGSTITQQLAKNLFLSREKSLYRKFLEGLITIKLEKVLTKNEILEKYLNVIEFGKGIYGIKAAAQHYFKKHPRDLTAAESAFLAMLLPNPVKYSTSFSKKELTQFAENRIRKILSDMHQYNRIDTATYEEALLQMPALFSPENMISFEAMVNDDSWGDEDGELSLTEESNRVPEKFETAPTSESFQSESIPDEETLEPPTPEEGGETLNDDSI